MEHTTTEPQQDNKLIKKIVIGVVVVVVLMVVGRAFNKFVAKKLVTGGISAITDGAVNIKNLWEDGMSFTMKWDDGETITTSFTRDKDENVVMEGRNEDGNFNMVAGEDGSFSMLSNEGEWFVMKNYTVVPDDFPTSKLPIYKLDEVIVGNTTIIDGETTHRVTYTSKASTQDFAKYYETIFTTKLREEVDISRDENMNSVNMTATLEDETISMAARGDDESTAVTLTYHRSGE